jgi:hypothetical protein
MKITCTRCKCEKDSCHFNNSLKHNNGKSKRCKACTNNYNRKRHHENPECKMKKKIYRINLSPEVSREYLRHYYTTLSGRAKSLMKTAKRRSTKFNDECDLDEAFLIEKLEKGVCEITGIAFDFNKNSKYSKNPYAPSIDRIDCSKGYLKSNVRMVLWQVNLMKGELADDEMIELCRKVIESYDN